MVSVPVAQDQRVDMADPGHAGQKPRRRPFAEIEHEPLAAGFDEEAGRPLCANARYQPQSGGAFIHYVSIPYSRAAGRGKIDNSLGQL